MGCSNENRLLRKPKHNKEKNSFPGPKCPLTAFLGITLDKFSVHALALHLNSARDGLSSTARCHGELSGR